MKRITLLAMGCLALLLVGAIALAEGDAAKKTAMPAKSAKPAMSVFLIESPHTAEECLGLMDGMNKSKELADWNFGCMSGNHTGYRMVHAADENAALAMVPESVRGKAHAYKVGRMTPAMLEAAHKHM